MQKNWKLFYFINIINVKFTAILFNEKHANKHHKISNKKHTANKKRDIENQSPLITVTEKSISVFLSDISNMLLSIALWTIFNSLAHYLMRNMVSDLYVQIVNMHVSHICLYRFMKIYASAHARGPCQLCSIFHFSILAWFP